MSVPPVDVAKIRSALNLTQEQFCERYHIPISALQMWEQSRRNPSPTSEMYLRLIQLEPKSIADMVERLSRKPRLKLATAA